MPIRINDNLHALICGNPRRRQPQTSKGLGTRIEWAVSSGARPFFDTFDFNSLKTLQTTLHTMVGDMFVCQLRYVHLQPC